MGKRQGNGYRVYSNGAKYIGQWENNLRHGAGTMTWPNGDIYRGEWVLGHMHGYFFIFYYNFSFLLNKFYFWVFFSKLGMANTLGMGILIKLFRGHKRIPILVDGTKVYAMEKVAIQIRSKKN